MKNNAVRFNMSMSPILYQKLTGYAEKDGLPKSSIVNLALSEYFSKRELTDSGISAVMDMLKNDPNFLNQIINAENK